MNVPWKGLSPRSLRATPTSNRLHILPRKLLFAAMAHQGPWGKSTVGFTGCRLCLPFNRLCSVSFSHTPTSNPLVNSLSSKYMQNSIISHPFYQYHCGLGHHPLFPDFDTSLVTSLFCFYVFLPLVCFQHSKQKEPIKQKSDYINLCFRSSGSCFHSE